MITPESTERQAGKRTWPRYAGSLVLVALATVVGSFAVFHVSPTNIVMLYLLAVVVSGLLWGQGAAVLSSVVGVVAFDYFVVPPLFSLSVEDAEYLITFAGLLLVAMVVGTLTGRLRDRALALRIREREASALVSFIRAMVVVQGVPAIAEAAARHVGESLNRPAAIIWREEGEDELRMFSVGLDLSPDELAGVRRVLAGVDSLGGEASPCPTLEPVAFSTHHGLVGVLAVRRLEGEVALGASQKHLLEAFAAQAATMVERAQLSEAAHRAEMLEEADRLHDALLNSVSHALRTPLSSIIGSLSALSDHGEKPLDPPTRADLIDTAREGAERLNLIVRDLLDMTRLQSGHLKLNLDWYDLEDVVGAALAQVEKDIRSHPIKVQVPEEPLLARLDQVLIIQVFANLLQNACKYSPAGTPVEISVTKSGDLVKIVVADRGPGIPPKDVGRVFEKFYRVEPGGGPSGSGLGLAICKGIVEAHGGQIWAQVSEERGTEFIFTLPVDRGQRGGDASD